ncbi:MAG: ATP-binding protein [Mycobacterium sp.]
MTPPNLPRPDSGDDRFTCHEAAADAPTAALIRDGFSQWLRRHTALDETRLCDVALAVNEALANTAEFAYPSDRVGTVDFEAVNDRIRRNLTITIADQGHWRDLDPLCRRPSRGRGIPLMRTLADSVIIDTSGRGTSICMRFDYVRNDLPVELGVC